MLAGMTSCELGDWHQFYGEHYFQDAQQDAHFSMLLYTVSSLFFGEPDLTPSQFSLLSASASEMNESEPDDDMLMAAAEGLSGGVRYGPDASR